jgi:hypothetical protein
MLNVFLLTERAGWETAGRKEGRVRGFETFVYNRVRELGWGQIFLFESGITH